MTVTVPVEAASTALTTVISTSTKATSFDAGYQSDDAVQLLKAHKAAVSQLAGQLFRQLLTLTSRSSFVGGTLFTIRFWLLGTFRSALRIIGEAH